MKNIIFRQVSSLEKVYLDYELNESEKELDFLSAMKNERVSYQIAYRGIEKDMRRDVKISVHSPLSGNITVRTVGNVPAGLPVRAEHDDNYERYKPGLFPDVLYPIDDVIEITCSVWHSLWVTVDLNGEYESGIYPIDIIFSDKDGTHTKHMKIEVIDAMLPEQKLIFTQWFHADCIADYYKVDVLSERHWELIDKFMAMADRNGINMMLTPVFTPPLDTYIGGERTTVQLVDIKKNKDEYAFDFTNLKKWIELCKKNNIKYFEIAHLFTQWGAMATPKIIAEENGVKKKIFGWEVESTSPEYKKFLSQFLPALSEELKKEGISQNTFFHISDEPSLEHKEKYLELKNMVKKYIPDYTICDALSEYEFFEKGITDLPIPASDHIDKFIENKVSNLWTYYCCAQAVDVSNRFMAMPSYRNRVIGTQLYKFEIKGFLHWGYNFYNSALSKKKINPFLVTDAIDTYQAGDAFSVYPGEDGPLESIRIVVFTEALQDLRALNLLETFVGKDEVINSIEDLAGMAIKFNQYPHDKEFILKLRKAVNYKIKEISASEKRSKTL